MPYVLWVKRSRKQRAPCFRAEAGGGTPDTSESDFSALESERSRDRFLLLKALPLPNALSASSNHRQSLGCPFYSHLHDPVD